jgi:hypothetical protein
LIARGTQPLLDALLRFLIHFERDVMKGCIRHLRSEQLLVLRTRKLKEGKRAAIA